MYSLQKDHPHLDESSGNSTCSETPSELEARLYSVLHYNDFNEPLPPEITSNYSITVSGTDVCIELKKNQPTSVNLDMPEGLCQDLQNESNITSLRQIRPESSHSEKTDTSKLINLKRREENGAIDDPKTESSETELLDVDFDHKLADYVSYVTWMQNDEISLKETVRNIMSNFPYPHSDSTSYANCKELILKYANPIHGLKKNLAKYVYNPKKLKNKFSKFIVEACIPRNISASKAVAEFLKLLSSQNVDNFETFNINEIWLLHSDLSQKCSNRKELVRAVVLKKFRNFLDNKNCKSKNECVETFCSKICNLLGELALITDTDFKEQMFATYEIYQAWAEDNMTTKNEEHSNLIENEDSSKDSCDGVPLKKRKLDCGKELIICGKNDEEISGEGSKNDVRRLLCELNPYLSERESLRRVFKRFVEFSMKEKETSKEKKGRKFKRIFAKFTFNSTCYNTLYSDLIGESLFRDLFCFVNELINKQLMADVQAIDDKIASLVKIALPDSSCDEIQQKVSKSKPVEVGQTVQSGIISNENVITLSSDESEGYPNSHEKGDSNSDCSDGVPLKKRKLDSGKELIVNEKNKSKPKEVNQTAQSEMILNENVITLSSDESDSELISRHNTYDGNPPSRATQDGELILNIQTCSVNNQTISEDISHASNSALTGNAYASNCPPSWSDEMISYYCKSWGGETFDHVDVLKELKATTKPSDWKVHSYQDLLPSRKRKRGPQCNRCLQWGHLQYQCREPNKPLVCSMCGSYNHSHTACTDTKCLRCGSKTLGRFQEKCKNCSVRKKCTLCDSDKHTCSFCPDLWRSYHLTVEGSIKIPPELPMNPRQYCCNCAKAGHLDYFCPLLRGSTSLNVINSPYVLNYNVEKPSKTQSNNSSVGINSVDASNADGNNSLTKGKMWEKKLGLNDNKSSPKMHRPFSDQYMDWYRLSSRNCKI